MLLCKLFIQAPHKTYSLLAPKRMKSTKVQNPRRIPRIKPMLLATPRGVAVLLPGQFSLLRGLAALVCLVWDKIEPVIRPSRTILHDALNGKTASSHRSRFMACCISSAATVSI